MRTLCLLILIAPLVLGCAKTPIDDTKNNISNLNALNAHKSNTLHKHVERLARQLLSTSQFINTNNTVAVGTILPAMPSSGESLPTNAALGIQIQESLMTFATQAGLKVIEYKTMPNIKIAPQVDKMLSRNVAELHPTLSADYFLTGTYSQQENTTMVNIRLIQVPENIVLAAATDYVPNDVMWSNSKVTLKNNQLYRNGY